MLDVVNLRETVNRALLEDLGRGDVTTDACVPVDATGRAALTAREAVVFCGTPLVLEVFAQLDPAVRVDSRCADGEWVQPGEVALTLAGPARSILKGERLALNFCQRLSGIATLTRTYVDQLPAGSTTRIADTRKTTPGLRVLERYAVRCGGGANHRSDLGAAVLIKDNHIVVAGGVQPAVHRARQAAAHTCRISCEVDDLAQLAQAMEAGVDVVLLDNFTDAQIAAAVPAVAGRALIEVSGRVSPDRVPALAAAGVHVISVGALTHSARSIDLGLDWTH